VLLVCLVSGCMPQMSLQVACCLKYYMWSDNKVCELIAEKMLHTSLLNTTVVTFKVLLLGSYAPCQRLAHPSKQFWNWFCGMAFRAAVVLLLISSMSSKCLPFNISFIFGKRKKLLGAYPHKLALTSLILFPLFPSLTRNLMFIRCSNSSPDIFAAAHQNTRRQ